MIANLKEFLNSLPLDTEYERGLLENLEYQLEQETLLVVGDAQASPYTLLPLRKQIFKEEDNPGFPVAVQYGDNFSILAVTTGGEIERYQSAEDFQHFCSRRYNAIEKCTVAVPDALLRRCSLVYYLYDENANKLNEAAKGCSGCIMVMPADAGGLSEAYLDLCGWLVKERCIPERVSLLLKQRGPFRNAMLPFMVKNVLNRDELGVFRYTADSQMLLPLNEALQGAVRDVQSRNCAESDTRAISVCCDSVKRKLHEAIAGQKSQEMQCGQLRDKYINADQAFQAICATAQYGIADLLTKQEKEDLRKETAGMFALLKDRFPKMVGEVAEKSKTAKDDLKNLATDYPGALMDAFIDKLMDEVSVNVLIPRTHERFLSVCDRFRRMMQDAELEYEELESSVEMELLRIGNINVGDYRPPFAQMVSILITTAIKIWLKKKIPEYGYRLGMVLESVIGNLITNAAVAMMSTKAYARSLTKAILEEMEKQEVYLYEQIETTILPRMSAVLLEEFNTLTGIYSDKLRNKAEKLAQEQKEAQMQVQLLEQKLAQLEKICSTDALSQ